MEQGRQRLNITEVIFINFNVVMSVCECLAWREVKPGQSSGLLLWWTRGHDNHHVNYLYNLNLLFLVMWSFTFEEFLQQTPMCGIKVIARAISNSAGWSTDSMLFCSCRPTPLSTPLSTSYNRKQSSANTHDKHISNLTLYVSSKF